MAILSIFRCFKYVALLLVALSAAAQLTGLALSWLGGAPQSYPLILALLGVTSFAVVPGMLLAFVLFLYYALYSVEQVGARLKAAVLLALAFLPFAGPTVVVPSGQLHASADVKPVADTEPESDQFLYGREWAQDKQPRKYAECPGSTDFRHGCEAAIAARKQDSIAAGANWARKHQPAKASACRGPVPYAVLGCRTYFFEHLAKAKAANAPAYRSREDCLEEVHAEIEARLKLAFEEEENMALPLDGPGSATDQLEDCARYGP
jgi:hypothetical protein